jgi:hypothetical protein
MELKGGCGPSGAAHCTPQSSNVPPSPLPNSDVIERVSLLQTEHGVTDHELIPSVLTEQECSSDINMNSSVWSISH